MSAILRASDVCDDMPPLLVVGSDAVAFAVSIAASSGRTVAFDGHGGRESLQEAASAALGSLSFEPGTARRRVGLIRLTGDAPVDRPLIKSVLSNTLVWWIAAARSSAPLGSGLVGCFTMVRTPGCTGCVDAASIPGEAGPERPIAAVVSSGARYDEILRCFLSAVPPDTPRHVVCEVACRLDSDIRRSRRPLLLTTLINHALAEVASKKLAH